MRLKVSRVLVTAGLLAAAMLQRAAAQNITIDGHLSPAQTLVGPNYAITANLGKQVGSNLFHSFGKFGLASSEGATFSGPATVSNVIGRVTGGAQSSIDGKIASTITGASLYLINPSGIVFGPNATVNVSGGFHASTADYLRMSDGAKFQATNPDASTLSAASPAAFGFLTAQPAKITVNGSSLGVPSGQTLGLVGGPVSIKGGTLSAAAGTIHVTSAADTGEVPVDPRNTAALTVTSFGPVKIKGGAAIDVSNADALGGGGSVFIRSGALTIDASDINADNYGSDPGGVISLRADKQITLSNSANLHAVAMGRGSGADIPLSTAVSGVISADAATVLTGTFGPGNGGSLSAETGRLTLTNGAGLTTSTQGTGKGGPIQIAASSVLLDGASTSIASISAGARLTDPLGNPIPAGAGGAIRITAGTLTIQEGASITTISGGDGAGGLIDLDIGGMLTIANLGSITSEANASGIGGPIAISAGSVVLDGGPTLDPSTGIFSTTSDVGPGGSITIVAGELALHNAANVFSESSGGGTGGEIALLVSGSLLVDSGASLGTRASAIDDAGDVSVIVAGLVTIDMSVGAAASLFQYQGISSQTVGSGRAGNVTVIAGNLSIAHNGEISSATNASGDAGSVTITVFDKLMIDGSGGVLTSDVGPTGVFSQAGDGSGAAGTVSVTAGGLSIVNNGAISASTFASGNAGNIAIAVSGKLTIDGLGENPAAGPTGIFSQASTSSAAAGIVSVTAGTLSIANGFISATTFASGNAGSIIVKVSDQLTIDRSGGIFSQADSGSSGEAGTVSVSAGSLVIANQGVISSSTLGRGKGGSVFVAAENLAIVNDGRITTDTREIGSGNAGGVSVDVAGRLTIDGASQTSFTGISSRSTQGSDGNAGEVTLSVGSLSIVNGGAISTTTDGLGRGGDVNITARSDIVLPDRGPQITARSTGSGNAGSITVSAARLLLTDGAAISTEAETSTANGGNITLHVRDFLYLVSSEISTSVKGETGNGGNITIDPQLVILNHSSIIAQAIEGHGGNITITAGQFIPSSDSIISATSQLGISGSVVINGPRVDVNGALVVLSSQLRGRTEVLREACAARADRPISSLVEAGRGGLPQDPEATLPALYIAGRNLAPSPQAPPGETEESRTLRTTARLRMRCG